MWYAVAVYCVCNQLSFRLPYYRVTGQGRGLLPTQPCGGKELKLYVRKSLSYKGQRNPGEGVQCQLKKQGGYETSYDKTTVSKFDTK